VAFLAVVLAVVVLVAYLFAAASQRTAPIDASAIPVRITMSGFSPNRLEATVGVPVRIDLINGDNQFHSDGGGYHNFVLEAFGVNVVVPPLEQRVFSFTPTDTGEFSWYCDMCCGGKENPAMIGRLVVSG
jgi:heme/copper-type cytochrome/quinol oxidase subunit 2